MGEHTITYHGPANAFKSIAVKPSIITAYGRIDPDGTRYLLGNLTFTIGLTSRKFTGTIIHARIGETKWRSPRFEARTAWRGKTPTNETNCNRQAFHQPFLTLIMASFSLEALSAIPNSSNSTQKETRMVLTLKYSNPSLTWDLLWTLL